MAKTTKPITKTDKNQDERALLDSWHPHIKSAMQNLHKKFHSDTKYILTESDLKCWLFYYLQGISANDKNDIYSVHTEITHFAPHLVKASSNKNVIELKKKYKYRDLSLFQNKSINDAEEIWAENQDDIVNSKGFKHTGPAIHFELKMIRQSRQGNQVSGLKADIAKLSKYSPENISHVRDFVIVCGSRSEGTNLEHFKTAVKSKIKEITNKIVKERLHLYLFDSKEMVCLNGNGEIWNEN
jgi:hypothetical protein